MLRPDPQEHSTFTGIPGTTAAAAAPKTKPEPVSLVPGIPADKVKVELLQSTNPVERASMPAATSLLERARHFLSFDRESIEARRQRELDEIATVESICATWLSRKTSYEDLLQWPAAVREYFDKVGVSDAAACEALASRLKNQRGTFVPEHRDLVELFAARIARELRGEYIKAVENAIAERLEYWKSFEREHTDLLRKYKII